jgi:NAD(P)-dependent dehydrogenase (short-subunit alcohol dehydrogenase family)
LRHTLVLGVTSAIAQETAKLFAAAGGQMCLDGRNTEKLQAIAADLQVRGAAKVCVLEADLNASVVKVVAIKPGLAETPMTAALNKGLLWVGPELIAAKNEEYVAFALRLGRDRTWRSNVSRRITATRHALFDDRPPRLCWRRCSFP